MTIDREVMEIIEGFLKCPEIADRAPEDKDPDTNDLERRARALISLSTEKGSASPQVMLSDELVGAARAVINDKQSTFKARNGRRVGIEDDSGEMCWIVGHETIGQLEHALQKATGIEPRGKADPSPRPSGEAEKP